MYLNVDEVESALAVANLEHPTITELIELPNKTWEDRTTHAIRIGDGTPMCGVYFIGGVHANEWGSSDILMDFVERVTDAYANGTGISLPGRSFSASDIRFIVQSLDVFVFPLVNPDGRAFSQDPNTGLWWSEGWRKNRRPGEDAFCRGVDINRNYDWLWDFEKHFDPQSDVRNSTDPCGITYTGPAPFSEPETKNVVWLVDQQPHIRYFIDLHSYSEVVLHPWGDDDNQSTDPGMSFQNPAYDGQRGVHGGYAEYIEPMDETTLIGLGTKMSQAIQAVHGRHYQVGQGWDLYPTAGTSVDYLYSRHRVDPTKPKILPFTIEWGSDQNPYPHHPAYNPTMKDIIEEVVAGLLEFCLSAAERCASTTFDPDRLLLVARILFGVIEGGGGLVILPGGKPIPIDPGNPLRGLSPAQRDVLAGLVITQLAEEISDERDRRRVKDVGSKLIQQAGKRLSP